VLENRFGWDRLPADREHAAESPGDDEGMREDIRMDMVASGAAVRETLPYAILDSDQHMVEPLDLWQTRVDARYRADAPLAVDNYKGQTGRFLVFGDEALRVFDDPEGTMVRAGGYDPAARIEDMAIDGVAAAVMFPTYGAMLFGMEDADLQEACFAAYNDWIADYCNYDRSRLAGVGMVSLFNMDHAAREVERCAKIGLKSVMVWDAPPPEMGGYWASRFDPLWAAAQANDIPVIFHKQTGPKARAAFTPLAEKNWASNYTSMVMGMAAVQETLCNIAFGGVLTRYPKLRIICAEADIAWVPGLLARMDKYYESRIRRGHKFDLAGTPSELILRNVWHSFIDDPVGMQIYQIAGLADRIMWATDYPHPACYFPNSMDVIARDFGHMPEEDKRKLLHDNTAEVFGFTW
jgi:predicted TIM-barrel fold metal-dependent hydrolase